ASAPAGQLVGGHRHHEHLGLLPKHPPQHQPGHRRAQREHGPLHERLDEPVVVSLGAHRRRLLLRGPLRDRPRRPSATACTSIAAATASDPPPLTARSKPAKASLASTSASFQPIRSGPKVVVLGGGQEHSGNISSIASAIAGSGLAFSSSSFSAQWPSSH